MNKTDIAYLRCIRYFLSFKTNILWFIVLFIFIYKNINNKDKLAYIKQINETFINTNCAFGSLCLALLFALPPDTNTSMQLWRKLAMNAITCFLSSVEHKRRYFL